MTEQELSAGMYGDEIKRLQIQLRAYGSHIPSDEFDRASFGPATQEAVRRVQADRGLPASGVFDKATAAALEQALVLHGTGTEPIKTGNPRPATDPSLPGASASGHGTSTEEAQERSPFLVRGHVVSRRGRRIRGLTVRAYDQDLRKAQLLGEARTTDRGYEIAYGIAKYRRAEKRNADLRIRVLKPDGNLVAESPIHFNAPPVATIDLRIDDDQGLGLSEYEELLAEIVPLLPPNLSVGQLREDARHQDFTFCAGETGRDRQHIAFLAHAHRLTDETRVPPDTFYGLFRQKLPTNLSALLRVSPRAQRRALEKSVRDGIIPARSSAEVDAILESLQQLFMEHAFAPPQGTGRYSLGDLLETSGIATKTQRKFVELYRRHEGSMEDFWKSLRDTPGFSAHIEDLQFTLQLARLTENNIPLVKALQALRGKGSLRSLRDLANLDAAAWTKLITTASDGAGDAIPPGVPGEEKVSTYVEGIIDTLKATFPTTYVRLGVSETPEIDGALVKQVLAQNPGLDPSEPRADNLDWSGLNPAERKRAGAALDALRHEIKMFRGFDYKKALASSEEDGDLLTNPIRKGVARFLQNAPDFELADTPLDRYLSEQTSTAFKGIPDRDRAKVVDQLKALQRVHRVTPRYEHMERLMGEGLDSAYAIASIPQAAFVDLFGPKLGGDSGAADCHLRAQQIVGTNTHIYASVHQTLHDIVPYVIGGPENEFQETVKEAVKKIPNWTTLFGRIDLCDCEHCRSIYSPAAYFVDLLQFLNPVAWNPQLGPKRPIDVLLTRRPDLEHIKLTCDNTNVALPYADLVNEILEYYIAHGSLDGAAAKNTEHTTAEELSVNPQYTNEAAYDKLTNRVYPFSLPFDRSLEIARTYLEHLGSSRHEVMEAFRKGDIPSELEIAWESLRVSQRESAILTGMDPPQQPFTALHQYYGYVNPAGWKGDIAQVPEFLQRTGIRYVDLLEMLKTRFLNPGITIRLAVVVSDPNEPVPDCDLTKLKISGLETAALEKLHRFIRLWRKCSWDIRDMDKVLAALQADGIDGEVLANLARVKRLQAELPLSLLPLLSLWADIDADGRNSLYVRLFQNKRVVNPADNAFRLRYAAPLESLPNVVFPESLKDEISYDAVAKQLRFVGSMTEDEKLLLAGLSTDDAYKLAIDSLFEMRASDGTELALLSVEPEAARISLHAPVLQAALRVTAEELALIREAAGLADPNAPLTLANLSKLYRYAVLARALKLKVTDLIALQGLTGINPFQPAAPASTVEFVEKARKVKQSGFRITQLDYLYRHLPKPPNKFAPQQEVMLLLAKNLREGLLKVIAETTGPPADAATAKVVSNLTGVGEDRVLYDPIGEWTRSKLAILFESGIVDQTIQMVDGSATYATTLKGLPEDFSFPTDVKPKITYDHNTGRLSFVGPMATAEKTLLLTLSGNLPGALGQGYQSAIDSLFQQPRLFLKDALSAFLDAADAAEVLLETASRNTDGTPVLLDDQGQTVVNGQTQGAVTTLTSVKFSYFLDKLLPYLRERLSRSLVKQTLSEVLKSTSATAELVLETLLKSATNPSRFAIDDFLALIETGLTGEYFSGTQLTGPLSRRIDGLIAFNGQGATVPTTMVPGAGSARWAGMLLAPNNGEFTFYIQASGSAQLWVGNDAQPLPLQLDPETNELASSPIALKVGRNRSTWQ